MKPQQEMLPLDRRSFLKQMAAVGGVAFTLRGDLLQAATAVSELPTAEAWSLHEFLWLQPSGDLILLTTRSEMGTGVRTTLPMVVADEMEADWSRVTLRQAIGDRRYGSQNTDGSNSIRSFFEKMRRLGAGARDVLERAAASEWGVDASGCRAVLHRVEHAASGASLGFGELVAAAQQVKPKGKKEVQRLLKEPKDWRYIGIGVDHYDCDDLIQGRATFGADIRLPDMLFASIERSPALGGSWESYDREAALAVPGVEQVVELPDATQAPFGFDALGGVAVLASDSWSAMRGREALQVVWKGDGPNADFDSEDYLQQLREAVRAPGQKAQARGDLEVAFEQASKRIEAEYTVPMLPHACMETPNATAWVQGDRCEVWSPTQNPQAVQQTVAGALGLTVKQVVAHVTLLGGGFGRKSKPDYTAEAALLSQASGRPVQVLWTRADDLRHDYYHAIAALRFEAGVDEAGRPQALLQRAACPPIASTFAAGAEHASMELGMGLLNQPIVLKASRTEACRAPAPVRIGWLRSVANIQNAFGLCSFFDELAHAAGLDPFAAWKSWLQTEGKALPESRARLLAAAETAIQASAWGQAMPKGHGLGFAAHASFDAFVAVVLAVEVTKEGKLHIPRVDIAADVGLAVNPDRVRAQMEGSVNFALSQALYGRLQARDGAIVEKNFDGFRLLRGHEAPRQLHVHLVDSGGKPTGVGEPGVPPVAPALCNAIFAASGQRIRDLPVAMHDLGQP